MWGVGYVQLVEVHYSFSFSLLQNFSFSNPVSLVSGDFNVFWVFTLTCMMYRSLFRVDWAFISICAFLSSLWLDCSNYTVLYLRCLSSLILSNCILMWCELLKRKNENHQSIDSNFFKKTIPAITLTPPPSKDTIFFGFSFFLLKRFERICIIGLYL